MKQLAYLIALSGDHMAETAAARKLVAAPHDPN